jgi:hypothetical protein
MSQLVSDEICFYDTATYTVSNAYDTFKRVLKLRKATIGFVITVSLSVCSPRLSLHETTRFHRTDCRGSSLLCGHLLKCV